VEQQSMIHSCHQSALHGAAKDVFRWKL